MPDTAHCLRPLFIPRLLEKLKNGESINLTGLRGAGCDRALRDLEKMAAAGGIPVLLLDMNLYKYSPPETFGKAVWEKMHGTPFVPNHAATPVQAGTTALALLAAAALPLQISEILASRASAEVPAHLFLLLDNFHKLLDNPQQKFSRQFFDDLNSLKNRAHISLCCVTEKSHLLYKIHVPNEQGKIMETTSWLDLRLVEIPRLTKEDIRVELKRQLGSLPNWQQEAQQEAIVEGIHTHEHPMELMDLLKTSYEFEDGVTPSDLRLQRAFHKFGTQIERPPEPLFSWEKFIGKLKEVSEIWKNFKPGK